MPGLTGWISSTIRDDLFLPSALGSLAPEPFHAVCPVPGIRNGRLYLIHSSTGEGGYGMLYDPLAAIVIAYWGEFYGEEFAACGTGDGACTVLRDLLLPDPPAAFPRLNGSFVLYVQHGPHVWIAGDRLASRPVYYRQSGDMLMIAADLKAFAQLRLPRPALNRNAMVSFVVNGHPIADETYYTGVKLLRPAHYIFCSPDKNPLEVRARRYWEYIPASAEANDLGQSYYAEQLASVLRASIRRRARHLENAVIPISGGFDSRGILASIREVYSGRLKTVSWGIDEHTPGADAAVGRKVAEYFATDHTFLRRRPELLLQDLEREVHRLDAANDDPLFHHNEPTLMAWIRTRLSCTILFRGDECFGYSAPAASAFEALGRVNVGELSQYPDLESMVRSRVRSEVAGRQQQIYQEVLSSCPFAGRWTVAKDWFYLEQRLFRSLNFSNYAKLSFLEARNPWLDNQVIEFFASLPEHYRYDKNLYRFTLTCMFGDLMHRIPIAGRNSLEDWGSTIRTSEHRQYILNHLVQSESPIHEIWAAADIASAVERFYSASPMTSLRTRTYEGAKNLLRRNALPVYRVLKKSLPGAAVVRVLPPEFLLGRLLILKLWCDRWAH